MDPGQQTVRITNGGFQERKPSRGSESSFKALTFSKTLLETPLEEKGVSGLGLADGLFRQPSAAIQMAHQDAQAMGDHHGIR